MQLERPRFRQDLVAEPIHDGNAKFVDVADPDSNAVYRFYEVEYALACAMDGERDVAGIVRWAQEELGLSANANEVKSVIATLDSLQFLDRGDAKETPAKDDDYLKAGVVVGSKRAQTPAPELELGNAGASAPAAETPAASPAQGFELAPGVTTGARAPAPPQAKADDIALGVPGRADVSVDLADQVKVNPSDVKEAVRASKVMNAVELPDDLKNALDQTQEEKPAAAAKPKRPPPTPAKGAPVVDAKTQAAAEAKNAEAQKAADAAKAEAAKAEAEAAKAATAAKAAEEAKTKAAEAAKAAAKATAKPLPKPVEAKQPEAKPAVVAPNAPEQKVSRPLIIGLVVVVLAVIAFLVYKNVIANHAPETENTPAPQKTEPVKPPPPPAPESEKLATNAPASESIKPVSPGTVEMIAASDAKVKEGDSLVRFTGAKSLDTEITALDKDIEQRVKLDLYKAQQARDAALASGNKPEQTSQAAKVAAIQKSLDDKQNKLTAKKADLDKLQIKSPANGTFTAKAKAGQKVTPTDELGMLVRAPTRTVTFKKSDPAAGPKARVILATKDNSKLSCIVTSTDANGTVIECPEDSAPEGTEVTFGGLDSQAAAGPSSQAAAGPSSQAAAGPSAAGSGSGSGSDGSAAGSGAGSAAGLAGSAGSASAAVPSPAPVRPTPAPRPRPAPKAPAAGSGEPTGEPATPAEKPATPPAGSDGN